MVSLILTRHKHICYENILSPPVRNKFRQRKQDNIELEGRILQSTRADSSFPIPPPTLLRAACREQANFTCLGIYIRLLPTASDSDSFSLHHPRVSARDIPNKSNFTFSLNYSNFCTVCWQSVKYKSLDYSLSPLDLSRQAIKISICIFLSTGVNYQSIMYVDGYSCLLKLHSYF